MAEHEVECFQYPLFRIVRLNVMGLAAVALQTAFQYPLFRIVRLNLSGHVPGKDHAGFQYPLFRIVRLNSASERRAPVNADLSVSALSDR